MYKVTAASYFLEERIPLSFIDGQKGLTVVKKEKSLRLVSTEPGRYIYIRDYGGVCFFNIPDADRRAIQAQWAESLNQSWSTWDENLTFYVDADKKVTDLGFEEIVVPNLNIDTLHIIGLNLVQSVALMVYQQKASELMEETRNYTIQLESTGKVKLKRKDLLKYLWRSLNIKNRICENLFVFQTPALSWNDEDIYIIDQLLNDELEIKTRHAAIRDQLDIIQDNLDLFKDLSLHQHSSNLE